MRAFVLLASAVPRWSARLLSAVVAAVLLATPLGANAEGTEAGTAPDAVSAVWTPQELQFKLDETVPTPWTQYTCQTFRDEVMALLLALGARKDLRVDKMPCTDTRIGMGTISYAPQVSIRMQVLRTPAEPRLGPDGIPARWKSINLVGRNGPLDVHECALAKQTVELILPLFSTRNVEYSSPPCHRTVAPVVHLQLEALVQDQK